MSGGRERIEAQLQAMAADGLGPPAAPTPVRREWWRLGLAAVCLAVAAAALLSVHRHTSDQRWFLRDLLLDGLVAALVVTALYAVVAVVWPRRRTYVRSEVRRAWIAAGVTVAVVAAFSVSLRDHLDQLQILTFACLLALQDCISRYTAPDRARRALGPRSRMWRALTPYWPTVVLSSVSAVVLLVVAVVR